MRIFSGIFAAWLGLVSAVAGELPEPAAGNCNAPAMDAGLPLAVCGPMTQTLTERVIRDCTGILASGATMPETPPAIIRYRRGLAHVQQLFCGGGASSYQAALADLDEAIRQVPAFREAFAARALAHEYSGDHLQAVFDFREAYRISIPPRWLVERLEIIENAP